MLVAPTPADTHGGYLLRTRTFLLPLRATLFSLWQPVGSGETHPTARLFCRTGRCDKFPSKPRGQRNSHVRLEAPWGLVRWTHAPSARDLQALGTRPADGETGEQGGSSGDPRYTQRGDVRQSLGCIATSAPLLEQKANTPQTRGPNAVASTPQY